MFNRCTELRTRVTIPTQTTLVILNKYYTQEQNFVATCLPKNTHLSSEKDTKQREACIRAEPQTHKTPHNNTTNQKQKEITTKKYIRRFICERKKRKSENHEDLSTPIESKIPKDRRLLRRIHVQTSGF